MKLITFILTMTIIQWQNSAFAQEEKPTFAPDSEIYLFELAINGSTYILKNGRNISNNDDYDSQPYFMPSNNALLFASARDGKQTDIYEFNIQASTVSQLTTTKHSEFSPKAYGENGNISFVSEGYNPYQSVWQLDRKTQKQSWLFNSKEPVGYYHIDEPTGDALFWSRYGWSVQYLNIKRNENRFVSGHAVPSSPQKIPNSNSFSFVHRQTNGMVWIKAFNPKTFSITHIAPIFDTNFEYAWAPNGDILRFNSGKLSIWPKGHKGYSWNEGQNISQLVKGKLGRLTISSNGKHLALVTTK